MPGIPKSRACQECKARRRKCDLAWPTCGPCQRKKSTCSGPSSLVKFVHGGNHRDSKAEPAIAPPCQQTRPGSAQRDGYAPLTRFRLPGPRSNISTPADKVASHLVSSMEKEPTLHIAFTDGYLRYIPARLVNSPCLLDAVNLFCKAYEDHRRKLNYGNASTLEQYGKVLHKLSRTLHNGRAKDAETLAAIGFLRRSEAIFDPQWRPFRNIHGEAIIASIAELGPPKQGDFFHLGAIYDNSEDLTHHFWTKGEESFLCKAPWKQSLLQSLTVLFPHEVRASSVNFFNVFLDVNAKTPKFVAKLREVFQDPFSPAMRRRAAKIIAILPQEQEKCRMALKEVLQQGLKTGQVLETVDPKILGGKSYNLGLGYFAGGMVYTMAAFMVGIAQILYQLKVLYELPGTSESQAVYRKECEHFWMFIPYQIEMDNTCALKTLPTMVLTIEAANEQEKDQIMDLILKEDEGKDRLPRDRAQLEYLLVLQAKVLTGRLPVAI